jgi:hypothetical protein
MHSSCHGQSLGQQTHPSSMTKPSTTCCLYICFDRPQAKEATSLTHQDWWQVFRHPWLMQLLVRSSPTPPHFPNAQSPPHPRMSMLAQCCSGNRSILLQDTHSCRKLVYSASSPPSERRTPHVAPQRPKAAEASARDNRSGVSEIPVHESRRRRQTFRGFCSDSHHTTNAFRAVSLS